MKTLILFCLCLPLVANAAVYYVDCAAADDTGNGTSIGTAWKTINKVNTSTFTAGDSILFNKGCTWREQLAPPSSGASGNPITFGAYGSGANPIINGSVLVSSWTDNSLGGGPANTWRASLTGTAETTSPMVWQVPAKVWFDNTLGTLKASAAALTGANEWYWAANTLYVYSTSTPASAFTSAGIEAATNDGIHITAKDYITVDGIDVTKANRGAFVDTTSGVWVTNITLQNGVYSYNGAGGIEALGTGLISNCLIQGNTTHHNGGSGIYGDEMHNCIIQNNTTYSNGDYQFWVGGIRLFYEASSAGGNIIQNNLSYSNIQTSIARNGWTGGGDGIHLDTIGDGDIVRYNVVHDNAQGGLHEESNMSTSDAAGPEFYGNISYANHAGLLINRYSNGPATNKAGYFYNNTLYGNTDGIFVYGDTGGNYCNNNVFKNNISSGNSVYQLVAYDGCENNTTNGAGNVYTYNALGPQTTNFIAWGKSGSLVTYSTYALWNAATGAGAGVTDHYVAGDPKFTNAAGGDFTLQLGSPAIDAGVNLGSTYQLGLSPTSSWPSSVSTLNQNSYGAGWEIGAFVFVPQVKAAPPAPPTSLSATVQ